ncbi:hypothetical protein ACHAWF_002459 [Thalassiosira exigua]
MLNQSVNTRFVLKGRGKLRFKCGDKVSCQVGDEFWQPGVIVRLRYKERRQTYPYQIRLVMDGRLIVAPVDDDACIKEATKEVPLRFKVGDRVACRCHCTWEHGTVINTWWYDGMQGLSRPYQVKLDDGCLIFAPEDCDSFIQESLQNFDPKKRERSTPRVQPSEKLFRNTQQSEKDAKLRFKVGDRVQCYHFKVGDLGEPDRWEWEPGIVMKLWYEQEDGDIYPYQIRLDSKSLFASSSDSDEIIKASTLPLPGDLYPGKNDPLFEDPPMKENDCPICFLPLPDKYVFQSCCGKHICKGCYHAAATIEKIDSEVNYYVTHCPFCRRRGASNSQDIIARLKKRVESKDHKAAVTLAGFYDNGEHGLQVNNEKSFELLKFAEELGSTECLRHLGLAYMNGEGVMREIDKARHYLKQSALNGDANSREDLAWIEFYEELNPWKAYKHFVIAAKFGSGDALKEVREGYSTGFVSKEDYSDALRSFQQLSLEKSSAHREKAAALEAYDEKSGCC